MEMSNGGDGRQFREGFYLQKAFKASLGILEKIVESQVT